MDLAKLVKDIGDLRYEAEYRCESGAPYTQTLGEGELRGILFATRCAIAALRTLATTKLTSESPSTSAAEDCEQTIA